VSNPRSLHFTSLLIEKKKERIEVCKCMDGFGIKCQMVVKRREKEKRKGNL
jgi:hypothetical protein